MTEVWYIDITNISEEQFRADLKQLPGHIQKDILRYWQLTDQQLKLYGKLLVALYCKENAIHFDWNQWEVSPDGKPMISGVKFNISHSGTIVIAGFSSVEIGIDIELIKEIDLTGMKRHFHQDEKQHISSAQRKTDAFFNVWTRKEAFLKAKGIGILKGLRHENCLQEIINDGHDKWCISSFPFNSNYQAAICLQGQNMDEFNLKNKSEKLIGRSLTL
ncbi:MAG: 4'-phosphopantetheinyl transferase superfamily protein [Crocinitomix sp.]|nr:4'-phosphopantetheinyl transferase superfamily protein [Crocinitomix sp.]